MTTRPNRRAPAMAAMMVTIAWALLGLVAGAFSERVQMTEEKLPVERQEVRHWLTCTECTDADLKRVVALGNAALRDLGLVFDRGAIDKALQPFRRQLKEEWSRQNRYARSAPKVSGAEQSEAQYVATFVANLAITYQGRAIRALSAIGTPEALKVLGEARRQVTDPRVTDEIDKALTRRAPAR